MKIRVNIVVGMIGAGKTTFINSLLKCGQLDNEKVCIIQFENGQINIDCEKNQDNIITLKRNVNEIFDKNEVIKLLAEYNPSRVFIECNGMSNIDNIIELFHDKEIKKLCELDKIACAVDGKSAKMYLLNMGNFINKHIVSADIIIFNNTSTLSKKDRISIRKNISSINGVAKIIEYETLYSQRQMMGNKEVSITCDDRIFNGNKTFNISLLIIVFGLIIVSTNLMDQFKYIHINLPFELSSIKMFNMKFMGILIETAPFILLGAFLSSILQVTIPSDKMSKVFPRNKILSCIMASVSGILFPVCDCGTIPVARGFLKQGIPISTVITFMLAAPIVNPIAIMSTIYAFPNMTSIIVYRIGLGILVSIIVGLVMGRNTSIEILSDNIVSCNCGSCEDSFNSRDNIGVKIKKVFMNAGEEFFSVGKFMIIGAFVSSIIQSLMAENLISINSGNVLSSLGIIIVFSMIFSVCSTSDAFIAKGFIGQFPTNSVIGFLILGPMINIKNVMMLFGSFKKGFVFKLITTVIIVSLIILINISI
ncbi:MAG: permease [Clostridium sp.]